MEVRLLRTFVTVARHGNFGAAARELSMSQPALTKQIQALERQTGSPLFTRGRHGAQLTSTGRDLLPSAAELVRRSELLELRMKRVALGVEGSLNIGFGMSTIDSAPRAVARFSSRHPGIDVSLEDMASSSQYEQLANNDLNIGFVRLPAPEGISSFPLGRDSLAIATPIEDDPPPKSSAGLASWLNARPLIRLLQHRGPGLTTQTEGLFADLGCRPKVLQEASDLLTILALVSAGVGAAIVPASAAAISPAGVRITPITGASASWKIGVAWNPDARSPVVDLFLRTVREAPASERPT